MTSKRENAARIAADKIRRGEHITISDLARDCKIGKNEASAALDAAKERHSMWMLSLIARPVVQS